MLRKNALSRSVPFSRLRIQNGNAPLVVTAQPTARMVKSGAPQQIRKMGEKSRNDFNVHPLRAHVVSNVFGGDGKPIRSWNGLLWNCELPGIESGLGIPFKTDRRSAIEARDQGSRALRRGYF